MAVITGGEKGTKGLSAEQLRTAATDIRGHFLAEADAYYPEWSITTALRQWTANKYFEPAVVDKSLVERKEFLRILESIVRRSPRPDSIALESNVFNGMRTFSFDRFRALTCHLATRTGGLFKTKLNKLLFYSDFVHYYIHGRSITGSRYVHLPFGPVPDAYEVILDHLSSSGDVMIIACPGFELVTPGQRTKGSDLDETEREAASWVIEKFGRMSSSEISEYSHREKAYRFTRMGDQIAYEYAKYFSLLPG
ncbi:MAG: Panacea domain-containing protein [Acidobacteriota bacterium]